MGEQTLIKKTGTLDVIAEEVSPEQIEALAESLHRMLYPLDGDPPMWSEVQILFDAAGYRDVPYALRDQIGEQPEGIHIILGRDEKNRRGKVHLEFEDRKVRYTIGLNPMSTTPAVPLDRFQKVEEMLATYLTPTTATLQPY